MSKPAVWSQKPKPEAICARSQMVDGVAGGAVDQKADDRAERDLIGDAADLGVVVERDTRGAGPARKVNRH